MALYQPTNVIPSSYTKGTVDAVKDNMEISWQVNGNSAMTAFQIDFYLNDANSTPVTSTGKKGTTPEEQKQLGLPFYGTDRFGRPQFFTWNSGVSWEDKGFTNGNEYKYKITQWYIPNENEYFITSSSSLSAGKSYFFVISFNMYISFTLPTGNYPKGTTFYYNIKTNSGYALINNSRVNIAMTKQTSLPTVGENLGISTNEVAVRQTGFNVVKTRSKPILTIFKTNKNYTNPIKLLNSLNTSIGYFQAKYEQQEGNTIRWIRWQVATANNSVIVEIIADTGDIYTPTLNYEYNGFFNGQQYAIRAIGESESGQECDSGWIFFNINIENQGKYDGSFNVQCLNRENATLLEWDSVEIIPPTVNPQGYEPQISNGSVTLNGKNGNTEYSVTWNKVMDKNGNLQNMNFASEWTAVWKGTTVGNGNLLKLQLNNNIFVTLTKKSTQYYLKLDNQELAVLESSLPPILIVAPNTFYLLYYTLINGVITQSEPTRVAQWQQSITSISIYGGDSGTTIYSISVYKGNSNNILPFYQNDINFEPVWNDPNYELYMTANFNGNLEGGTGTATGKGFRVYRQEVGKNILTPITTVPSTTTSIKDYGIVSRKAYKYSLYAYDNNGAFMSAVENEKVVATCFKNYSLLVCDYDEENDEYHVRKQYLFALNLSTGSVGNNNTPTLNANFTRYPTRMPSVQNYTSGTLQGLIGAIYTVPALIEQIGNYKWTAKPSTLDYFDSVDLEQELYDLSTAPYQLFLRDMKGRLRMIATNGAVTMTTNIKQKQQSISISFPWVEIGDASDVTIIQTPDDYGWNNDNQVLDVSLDVDVETGELSATYPYPYKGTKFYLTGVNKETLTAKTPLGITPAQFELSETATQHDDGELNATVKVNSEDN